MKVIRIIEEHSIYHTIVTLNAEFYPIPPVGSTLYYGRKAYQVKGIMYDIDEGEIRVRVSPE